MTAYDDTDHRIAAWFGDQPVRAPDRTIDAALAHARAHPRRPDPLAAFRRDPMGRGIGIGALFAPVPLVAVVALLVVTALGGAVAGGFLRQPPRVVVLSPSPVPSPTASPTASSSPSASPSPTVFHVDLTELYGADASIDVIDRSGTVISAATGTPSDGGSVPDDAIVIAAGRTDPTVMILTWTGTPCDTTHTLDISPDGRTLTITRPPCSGDAFPRDLQLQLHLSAEVDVAGTTGRVVTE
jgi:hypothetical protein